MRCLRGGGGEIESVSGSRKNGASKSLILRGAREMKGSSRGIEHLARVFELKLILIEK